LASRLGAATNRPDIWKQTIRCTKIQTFLQNGAYKLQERPLGVLSKSILRKLEGLNAESKVSGVHKPAPPISLKAGTRLIRGWRGVTHTVLVQAQGFEWNGRRYRTLSVSLLSANM
jgi:hypothetical protein